MSFNQVWSESRQIPSTVIFDPLSEPAARCAVMVEKWNGPLKAPSKEAFLDLHPNICNSIDIAIRAYMYPCITGNANFIKALNERQKNSDQETPAP